MGGSQALLEKTCRCPGRFRHEDRSQDRVLEGGLLLTLGNVPGMRRKPGQLAAALRNTETAQNSVMPGMLLSP